MARQRRTITGPMARVAAAALNFSRPFSAEEIVQAHSEEISRGTVYRTLTRMLEADVLRRVIFNGHESLESVPPDD